jgi:hypothetical protein
MASNHLEQLVAEWYEYQGYFIRRNVKVGRRPEGGYAGELDIVGFHPDKKHLVHIETSLDALSWAVREEKYQRKFDAGAQYIPALFAGMQVPAEIDRIAVLVFASKRSRTLLGGGKIVLVSELLEEIFQCLESRSIYTQAVDEQKPLLRTLQFVAEYRDAVCRALTAKQACK